MNLPFFIARKYFFSRKISNVIHMISGISLVGIMVGTMALIIILSTFNGFEEVVSKLYNTFDSDLKVVPAKGKYFQPDQVILRRIHRMKEVSGVTPVLEENALVKYRERQTIATFKALEPAYLASTGIDSMVFLGDPILKDGPVSYALVGAGVAAKLDLHGYDDMHSLNVYVPKKGQSAVINPEQAFNRRSIFPNGIFSIQQDFDQRYILLPLDFAHELTDDSLNATGLEINVRRDEDITFVQEQVQQMLGPDFKVQDRYQQQPLLYKVMRTEKTAVYLVLTFILLIAAFNLIGALLMLAIEKQKDMAVLMSLGATPRLVRNIILMEGLLLSFTGAIAGIALGTFICWLQKKYGLVSIGSGTTFVIKAYPVAFNPMDFVVVFITVLVLGFIASYYPAISARKRFNIDALRSRR